MFDFAWSELALIAVVGLVVIGPKDLPRVMRTVGFWVRKARAVAHEFQGSLEQMVREAELDEVRQQVDKATRFNFEEEISKHVDPKGELHGALADPVLTDPLVDRPVAAAPAAPALAPPPPPEPAPAAARDEPPEPAETFTPSLPPPGAER